MENGKLTFQIEINFTQCDTQNEHEKVSYSKLSNEKNSLGDLALSEFFRDSNDGKKKEGLNAIVESLRADSNLLEIALEHILNCKRNHFQQYETSQARDLERFLSQVHNFQALVSQQILPLLEKIQNNKN
ncbi:hypothetical protein [Riemerella anatipestifer]|uniref:hypothetical protein n=1 Tax=Riemerella anatipestifer TaxID=34085 RepID=UPI002363961A|nr:hypothetical protein [Riemerella anatipestifer]MDD1525581.1 hypothetical protein [Riemerella anatipestifer]